MERKTMLQFLNKEMPNGLYFSNKELERIEQAANNFADQEKEAEAVNFMEWCDKNYFQEGINDWRLHPKGDSRYTTSELYQIFKQQTGGK